MTNRRRNRGASRPRAGATDEANGFRADIAAEKPDEPRPLAKPIWLTRACRTRCGSGCTCTGGSV